MAIDHANARVTFGEPIGARQAIQWMIADSEVEIEATKWLAFHTAWMAEQGQDTRHAAAIAKLYGANMANRVADRVLQIHGGMGFTRELPIERWYREMRVWRIFEGTDEIQRFIIARDLLHGYSKVGELL
jgi:acyl-CoA dehydrogenase